MRYLRIPGLFTKVDQLTARGALPVAEEDVFDLWDSPATAVVGVVRLMSQDYAVLCEDYDAVNHLLHPDAKPCTLLRLPVAAVAEFLPA